MSGEERVCVHCGKTRSAHGLSSRLCLHGPGGTEFAAPDPTAGEHNHRLRDGCRAGCPMHASPPAVAASTGTSEDVEALAKVLAGVSDEEWLDASESSRSFALDDARRVLASDWLAGREAAARAEERERIAQAIEAEVTQPLTNGGRGMLIAARIAREGQE